MYYSKMGQSGLPIPQLAIQIDFENIFNSFQNVMFMGELRQRWLEIKKFQKGMVLAV